MLISYDGQSIADQNEWVGTLLYNFARQTNLQYCPMARTANNRLKPTFIGSSGAGMGTADLGWDEQPYGGTLNAASKDTFGSYGINGWFYTSDPVGGAEPTNEFLKTTGVQQPSRTPEFADANWLCTWPRDSDTLTSPFNFYTGSYDAGSFGGIGCWMINRHGGVAPKQANQHATVTPHQSFPGAINIALADGHAETMQLWTWNQGIYRFHH